jgi:hypothetical protein
MAGNRSFPKTPFKALYFGKTWGAKSRMQKYARLAAGYPTERP